MMVVLSHILPLHTLDLDLALWKRKKKINGGADCSQLHFMIFLKLFMLKLKKQTRNYFFWVITFLLIFTLFLPFFQSTKVHFKTSFPSVGYISQKSKYCFKIKLNFFILVKLVERLRWIANMCNFRYCQLVL